MAKRLTDNSKWNRIWFRKLTPTEKCFWIYILDNCDHAGIWEVDFETAEHFIGSKILPEEIKQVFVKQFIEINGGNRWFIKDFINFQYNCNPQELNPKNKLHLSVINILKRHSIIDNQGACKGLDSAIEGDINKDKDINKNKVKVEDCEQYFEDAGYERKLGRVFWGYYNAQSWTTGGEHPRKIDDWTSKAFEIINSPKKLKWLMGLEENNATTKNFGNREFKSKLADEGRGNIGKPFNYITSGSKSDA